MSGYGEGAFARNAYQDLEANKPLRNEGGDRGTYDSGNQHVPTAEPLGGGLDGDSAPFAEAIEAYDVSVRHGFIRKVIGILAVQLIVTFGFVLACTYHSGLNSTMLQNSGAFLGVSITLTFGSLFGLVCFGSAARSYPTNYILLSVFTIAETLLLGSVAATVQSDAVAMAVGTTVAAVIVLGLFAFQTKYDFTGLGPYLLLGLWIMIMYGFIGAIFGLHAGRIYAVFGTILFSFYLVYDIQLIIGGKNRKFAISVDDYVLAALTVYLDIINLFLYLLQLFSDRN